MLRVLTLSPFRYIRCGCVAQDSYSAVCAAARKEKCLINCGNCARSRIIWIRARVNSDTQPEFIVMAKFFFITLKMGFFHARQGAVFFFFCFSTHDRIGADKKRLIFIKKKNMYYKVCDGAAYVNLRRRGGV